jgi:hypothetical protein
MLAFVTYIVVLCQIDVVDLWSFPEHIDRTAYRVTAGERALRATQNLDSVNIPNSLSRRSQQIF